MVSSRQEFDPLEFLNLAEVLAQRRTISEAEARTAISRSYYAVHLYCRGRLTTTRRMNATGTGGDHLLVVQILRSLGGSDGDQVDSLRRQRTRADYNMTQRISSNDAAMAVALARALFQSLPARGI